MSEYKIKFELKTNLHIGSGFSFAGLIDKTTIKNGDGIVIIPGSTIKGKIRSACKKIAQTLDSEFGIICQGKDSQEVCKKNLSESCIICRLFGSVYNEGKLIFNDAYLSPDIEKEIKILNSIDIFTHAQSEIRSSNKISRFMKTSCFNHLYIIENCLDDLVFKGKISTNQELLENEKELLKWGIKSITHIGGQKGRGLGKVNITLEGI